MGKGPPLQRVPIELPTFGGETEFGGKGGPLDCEKIRSIAVKIDKEWKMQRQGETC